ncbi:LOW QUALITY PROTEIN: hypothetical protein SSOG_04606, partial [Streptomyces himastatinicus ATCC 53653]
ETEHGLVISLEGVVGTKVRALADRGLARGLTDVRAAADRWSHTELETLGHRHARDSSASTTSMPGSPASAVSTTPNWPHTASMMR